MKKIRIAFCIAELLAGGAEKALTWLMLRLDRNRFEPILYLLRSRAYHAEKPNYLSVIEESGIPIQFLDIKSFFSLPKSLSRFSSELRSRKTDILLSFMFHANLLGRIAARRGGIPIVLSGIRVSEREHKLHVILDRFTSKKVDRYICVSRSAALFTEKYGRIPPEKITVIPNGVTDIQLFKSDRSVPLPFENDSAKRLLFAGRLVPQKGLDWILKNAASWLGTEAGKEWSFWIAGEGPQEGELRKLVSSLPPEISGRIHFTGWQQEIPRLLAATDLLLLPSRYEGMPNILLEASMAGIPVLSSHCDGADEILGENRLPQTFSFGDDQEFRQKITALMTDEQLRCELGRKNRVRAEKTFSIEKMTASYEELFESLYSSFTKRIP